jgi:hypothetical protein
MFDDSSSTDSDSLDFHFTSGPHLSADYMSSNYREAVDFASLNTADSASLDSMSLDSVSVHNLDIPLSQPVTDADLAKRARQRELAAAKSDGQLREAPTVEAALAALNDIGKVLRPPRKRGPGFKMRES